MIVLPITLAGAAAAAFINIWLASRIVSVRRSHKVSVGDGGNEALLRRMRAQANFTENAPIFLVLLAATELAGGDRTFLLGAMALFMLARLAHGIGMDGGGRTRFRSVGMVAQTAALVALAVYAPLLAGGRI